MTRFFSYGRASLRLWRRQWVGVLIAITGLVGALAISLLTAMYLYDGLRSDSWLETSDRLYRVNQQTLIDGEPSIFSSGAMTVLGLGPVIPDAVPEVEAYTRLRQFDSAVIRGSETAFEKWIAVDQGFSAVFPLPMVTGSLQHTLAAPDRLALSETQAQKYGGKDAIGKTLEVTIEGKPRTVEIVAIYKDIPGASHLELPAITLLHEGTMPTTQWMLNWTIISTYVLLGQDSDVGVLAQDFGERINPLVAPGFGGRVFKHSLEPVEGLMFHTKQGPAFGMKRPLNKDYLYGLFVVSLVLLLSAGFNFVTVFSAINLSRGREIAVRRLAGAGWRLLFHTAWAESTLLVSIAFMLSLLVAADLAPLAEEFVGGALIIFELAKLPGLLGAFLLAMLFALLASSYASLVVLSKRPADLMRESQGSVTGGGTRMRQGLVFVQALVLTATLAAAAQIQMQTQHLLTMDRGMAQTGVLFVDGPRPKLGIEQDEIKAATNRFRDSFRNSLDAIAGVHASANSDIKPFNSRVFIYRMRNPLNNQIQEMSVAPVGPDYFGVTGVRVLDSIEGDITKFSNPVAMEKRMLSGFGFDSVSDALGYELISEWKKPDGEVTKTQHKIVSVIDDMDVSGFRKNKKMLYGLNVLENTGGAIIAIQYDVAKEQQLRAAITDLWRTQFPEYELNIQTIEEAVAEKFSKQADSGIAVSIIAGICAVLGFAGLYGMAVHWLSTRQRELALRRVMGASGGSIGLYACKKMLAPVLAGCVVGVVPAWWVSGLWLEQFSDQAPLGSTSFAGGVLLITAFATTVLLVQVRLALRKRPARVLYHE